MQQKGQFHFLPAQARSAVEREWDRCRETKNVFNAEYTITLKDGSTRCIWMQGLLAQTHDGLTRWVGINVDITEQRNTKNQLFQQAESLRLSEEQFRMVADSIPQLCWMADPDGNIFWYNRRWYDYTGTTLEQMQGWGWKSVQDPLELPRVMERWMDSLARGEPWEDTFALRRHDGKYAPFLSRAVPLKDDAGQVIRWIGTNTDISATKEAEERVRASEERLAALLEQLPVGVGMLGLDGQLVLHNPIMEHYVSEVAPAFLALDRHERWKAWKPDGSPLPPTEWPGVRALRGERVVPGIESQFTEDDGRQVWTRVATSPMRDTAGAVVGAVTVLEEIDSQRRAEERNRLLSEAAAILLFAEEPDAMLKGLFAKIAPALGLDVYFNYMVDDSGTGLALASWLGVSQEAAERIQRIEFGQAVCGRVALSRHPIHVADLQRVDDSSVELVKPLGFRVYACQPLLTGNSLLGTLSFASRSRGEFTEPELEFLGTISRYVAAAYERLRLVDGLREADRKKSEFLSILAHELRNPLAPIQNGLQIMKLADGEPEVTATRRHMMERQVKQMTHLIDDLMDLTRVSQGKIALQKTTVPVAEAVRNAVDACRPLLEQQAHELVLNVPHDAINVQGDLTRLSQVLSNLLNNAAKYTNTGGQIRLAVERRGNEVAISVTDNGVGIPAHMLSNVFDMFTQVDQSLERSQGGLGIGLSVVKRLVEMHGGAITVASGGQGMGSVFTVRLPVVDSTSDKPDSDGTERADAAERRRVLVVDDNVDGAASLTTLLGLMGSETQTAHDGLEAVALTETFRPDVILMDIGMPKLNGLDACRRIREQPWGKDIIIIAQTGWGQEDDRRLSCEARVQFPHDQALSPTPRLSGCWQE